MSYFQAVRLYSLVEVCIFTSLIVVAVGGFSESVGVLVASHDEDSIGRDRLSPDPRSCGPVRAER